MLAGPAGKLEALLEEPEEREPTFAAVVCHPHPQHGGTMHNKVVYRIARGMRAEGAVTLRFNYRGVNLSEGSYDEGRGETDDGRAALTALTTRYPALPFALAGFSFGSRVAYRLAEASPSAQFVMCIGMPTAYFEQTDMTRCAVPRIFIHSTNDQFGPQAEFQAAFDRLDGRKRLYWVEANDHFFTNALEPFEMAVRQAVQDSRL